MSGAIFISYARKDATDLALRLKNDLADHGFDAWLDTQRIDAGAFWTNEIETAIDRCQYVLALLTHGSFVSEICRAEQLRSLRKSKSVIPILAQSGADVPLHLEARNYLDFSLAGKYAARLDQLLEDIRSGQTAVTLKPEFRATYLTVPALPANFLPRPAAVKALRDLIISDDNRRKPVPTALIGMGGIGKTVLAREFCHDEVVQQAFPDGVVWVTAGRDPSDPLLRLREVGKALRDDLGGYENLLAAEHSYRTALANKAALIVVDDVWNINDFSLLFAESPRSRFLFTTRDASMATFAGAQEYRAQLLDLSQARELFAAWAGLASAKLPAQADDLIQECDRLPGAISIVGALVKGSETAFWDDTLQALRTADIAYIEELIPAGKESFFKAIEVSFRALKPATQERYLALAVLPEDLAVDLQILQMIWGARESDARRTLKILLDRSLAEHEGISSWIRLHDLQLDYLVAQYRDPHALKLIQAAIKLSSHVIQSDPAQFASQVIGRLLPFKEDAAINKFCEAIASAAPSPWIRPLSPSLHPPGTALIRTLAVRASSAVALSADGRLALCAGATLKVWDLTNGRELQNWSDGSTHVKSAAISADGRVVVSTSEDDTLRVWNVESGQLLRTLAGHQLSVNRVALSANGRLAVSGSDDTTIKVWDVESGQELRTLAGHTAAVNALALSADGRVAVSASGKRSMLLLPNEPPAQDELKVWDLEKGCELRTLTEHGYIGDVALSADGSLALSAGGDSLKVWEVASGRELRTLDGGSGPVALSADGRRAVSAGDKNAVKVWDLVSGRLAGTLPGLSRLSAVAISANGQRAVSTSWEGTLSVWDTVYSAEPKMPAGHLGSVTSVAVSSDASRAISTSGRGGIFDLSEPAAKVWSVKDGRELHTLPLALQFTPAKVALSSDGQLAISTSGDELKIWDAETGLVLRTLSRHANITSVALSLDGRVAISGSGISGIAILGGDGSLQVWDVETGSMLANLRGHTGDVNSISINADGTRCVSGSSDHTVRVWNVVLGYGKTLMGHSGPVKGVSISADGRLAISASDDKTLKLWDVPAGCELRTMHGTSLFSGVALSPDLRFAVSASLNKTLEVWDLNTGAVIAAFSCDSMATCCAVAGNLMIVAGDQGGKVHFLSLEPGAQHSESHPDRN